MACWRHPLEGQSKARSNGQDLRSDERTFRRREKREKKERKQKEKDEKKSKKKGDADEASAENAEAKAEKKKKKKKKKKGDDDDEPEAETDLQRLERELAENDDAPLEADEEELYEELVNEKARLARRPSGDCRYWFRYGRSRW